MNDVQLVSFIGLLLSLSVASAAPQAPKKVSPGAASVGLTR